MKKTLTVLPLSERTEAPALQKRGRGWNIAESRLDAIHDMARAAKREPTAAQALLGEKLGGRLGAVGGLLLMGLGTKILIEHLRAGI